VQRPRLQLARMEQVEYTIYAPVVDRASQQSMAASNNSFCRWEHRCISLSSCIHER